jgi:hypothetical protein
MKGSGGGREVLPLRQRPPSIRVSSEGTLLTAHTVSSPLTGGGFAILSHICHDANDEYDGNNVKI